MSSTPFRSLQVSYLAKLRDVALAAPTSGDILVWNGSVWENVALGSFGYGDALTSASLAQFAATTSAQLAGVISDETGTGSLVFSQGPALTNASLTTPLLGTPQSGNLVNCTGYLAANLSGTLSFSLASVQDFRLTLTSGTPVTTSNVTGATTIYASPYGGNQIALYDGSSTWNVRSSAEMSLALGSMTNGIGYDIFCYDNSGTPTLEKLAWSSATARATPLVYQNGVLVKSGDTRRRYLGTILTTSTTTTEDSETKRYVWNYYHRKARKMRLNGSSTWTDGSSTWTLYSQLLCMIGWVEDDINFRLSQYVYVTGSSVYIARAALSHNSYSGSPSGPTIIGQFTSNQTSTLGITGLCQSELLATPTLGQNSINWMYWGDSSIGLTFWGAAAGAYQSGVAGHVIG